MKVLFLIMAGRDLPGRLSAALAMAVNSLRASRYEDLKVIFFGPSEEYLGSLGGQDLENLRSLIDSGAVDSACVSVAEKLGVKEKLSALGLKLYPAGEALSKYVNSGYQVISF
ncbi:hypothetical protein [Conexivisphaera calida]|uniref:DsrE family protein n=1 Tax=Conexivisphaera calida TaxID=1874277 RepID=A0A4P2VFR2_9ARCH|nr:hypothetical protein [Conexivisphaera calida]BBE42323.1 hypothetical protein NAS2_0934 [Conexivisphaera calida]